MMDHLIPINWGESKLVHIPPGSFLMGTSNEQINHLAQSEPLAERWQEKGYFSREQPQHTVHIPGFFIGKFPVTVGEYRTFINAKGYHCDRYWTEDGWAWRCYEEKVQQLFWDDEHWSGNDQLLVVGVSWYEAYAYCGWLSEVTRVTCRLPTEAEW